MRALVFRHSLAREAASAIGGRVDSRAFVSRFAPVRIEDVDELPLPASDWVRLLATGGTLVVSGVEPPRRFEWTPLYFKELRVVGSNGFGIEEVGGVAKHAMQHYFDFVSAGLDLTPVITHRFPLERWDEAVLALKDARRTGAVKVLLEP